MVEQKKDISDATTIPGKWSEVMEDADWASKNKEGMLGSAEVKDQEMKADSEEIKKEAREILKAQAAKIHQEELKNKFGGGGVHTNEEKTVEQYFGYYAKLANQQNML